MCIVSNKVTEFLANQLVDFQTVNYGKTGSYESSETFTWEKLHPWSE